MKVGMTLPVLHSVELNDMTLRAFEALGLDSVWLPDHMLGLFHEEIWQEMSASAVMPDADAWLDPFVLAGILGQTTDLLLGTAVTDTTRRRGPDLARAAATLNHSCRGGFVLGVGSGEAESIVPYGWDYRAPINKMEAALKEMRALFDTGLMPDRGVGRLAMPAQPDGLPPQIWLAAHGPRMLDLCGRFADGWVPAALSPEQYTASYQRICAAAEDAGRPRPTASMFPLTVFGESREHVEAQLEAQPLGRLVTLFASAEMWRRHGVEHPMGPDCRGYPDAVPHSLSPDELRDLAKIIPFSLVCDFLVVGNAVEIRAELEPYARAGLTHVILADMTGLVQNPADMPRLMGEVGALVVALKSRAAAA
jgi:phthiodiolone/phenolphthiodiolone dimycocerosates ketoreductase